MFRYDAAAALARDDVARRGRRAGGACRWSRRWPRTSRGAPRLTDRDAFRAARQAREERHGRKGKALFHPIRVAVTGEPEGPELDLLVPAIDRAADFTPADGLAPVIGCRERAPRCATALRAT